MAKGRMRTDLYPELFRVEDKHWWHIHKRQVVWHFIHRLKRDPGTVLDIGAGMGKILAELKLHGWQVNGVDSEPQAISLARRRGIKLALADLNQPLPFTPNRFDLVLCLDTLEHLKNDRQMILEITRVTKPKGLIIISVPAYPWLFSYWDKILGHQRRYSWTTLKKLISTALKIEYFGFYGFFWLPPAILIRWFKAKSIQPRSDFLTTPLPWLSLPLLRWLSWVEQQLLKVIQLPWGLSL